MGLMGEFTTQQQLRLKSERRKAGARKTGAALRGRRKTTQAERQEIADYLAREPVPRSYV